MLAATCDANELKMLVWAVHLMKMHSCNVAASDPSCCTLSPLRTGQGTGQSRQSRQVAELLLCYLALFCQPWSPAMSGHDDILH